MQTLMVAYDLRKPGRKYDEVIEYLKSFGTWWHSLESMWFIRTSRTETQVRDRLVQLTDASDGILVVNMSSNSWAGSGLGQDAYDWLRKYL